VLGVFSGGELAVTEEIPDPAWSAQFSEDDWEYLDSITFDSPVSKAARQQDDDGWAGRGFTRRDGESTT
jgi:hypothetical protein